MINIYLKYVQFLILCCFMKKFSRLLRMIFLKISYKLLNISRISCIIISHVKYLFRIWFFIIKKNKLNKMTLKNILKMNRCDIGTLRVLLWLDLRNRRKLVWQKFENSPRFQDSAKVFFLMETSTSNIILSIIYIISINNFPEVTWNESYHFIYSKIKDNEKCC